MAIEIPGFNPGCFKAKQSLVDQQFHGVYLSGNFEIDKVTDGTKAANAIGVLQDKPLLGEGGNVMTKDRKSVV